ncbi:hypothetical protein TD95_005416 [Thielaviopsis punctulata]|uniref:Zn(2)-C6 fungal-type domain-containing protein n=1 Tax=Thielaviopsis punctulata TaxID=72032 RepID=A0A0F4ZKR3_9PEZI|nr:hypothetical protein TD95_005416 [Thielaviopsis punctulata]
MYNAMNIDQQPPSQFQHSGIMTDDHQQQQQFRHHHHHHHHHQQQQQQQQMGIAIQVDSMGNPIYISSSAQPAQSIMAAAVSGNRFLADGSATSGSFNNSNNSNMGMGLVTSATSATIMGPSQLESASAPPAPGLLTAQIPGHMAEKMPVSVPVPVSVSMSLPEQMAAAASASAMATSATSASVFSAGTPAQQLLHNNHQRLEHFLPGSSAGIGALAGIGAPLCSGPQNQKPVPGQMQPQHSHAHSHAHALSQPQPQTPAQSQSQSQAQAQAHQTHGMLGLVNAGNGSETNLLGYPAASLGLPSSSSPSTSSFVAAAPTSAASTSGGIFVPASLPGSSHPSLSQSSIPPSSFSSSMSSPPVQSSASVIGTSPSSVGTAASASAATAATATGATGAAPQAVSAACLACRAKHLKCDGRTPCGRCTSNQSECVYIASRRGYKGPKAKPAANNPHKRRAESDPDDPAEVAVSSASASSSCPMLLGHNSGVPASTPAPQSAQMNGATTSSVSPGSIPAYGASTDAGSSFSTAGTPATPNMQLLRNYDTSYLLLSPSAAAAAAAMGAGTVMNRPINAVKSIPDRCLDSFYHHFFAAHPFVLPKEHLLRVAKDGLINHLLTAMRYIGSLYLNVGPNGASFFEEAWNLCYSPTTHKDGFLVQAMLLIILGLDGSCQRAQARKMLADVERIAVEIGLNTRPFATMHGRGIPVLEESWRRTWWDLFVVDGMIAGVHRETNFELYDVPCNVALPCEEAQYVNGTIPQPMYLEDLENADFSGEDREFSSFAYRILSGRILGRMMRTPPFFGPDDENVDKIEAMLTNWRLHLPPSKRDALDRQLQLDEMMFQATMMNRA